MSRPRRKMHLPWEGVGPVYAGLFRNRGVANRDDASRETSLMAPVGRLNRAIPLRLGESRGGHHRGFKGSASQLVEDPTQVPTFRIAFTWTSTTSGRAIEPRQVRVRSSANC